MLLRTPPYIGNWQRFLNDPASGGTGAGLVVDEDWGPKTQDATQAFQIRQGLAITGAPDEATIASALALTEPGGGFIPFVQAKNCNVLYPKKRAIDLIVIHDMEYPENPQGAEWCAQFFAGASSPRASAHYAVDSGHVVQMVRDTDVAWHAPGGNRNGIGIEHAGFAKQSRDEWHDAYSEQELTVSARLVARLCGLYNIPLVALTTADLQSHPASGGTARGICGHKNLTDAFSKGVGHWDPGLNFDWLWYLEKVKGFSATASVV